MDRRLFAIGLAATLLGVAGLGYLLVTGVLQHPSDAADQYRPTDFALIGGFFVSLAVGVVLTFRSYVDLDRSDRSPDK
ncbi:hypothetical protein EL22_19730 [Halostagnicola sp. A56]|uniref:hypothetical protein n=1 Tax=Halostagnicola sp. A56 TaxID=1495067 RepID=UPI00049FBDEF|nr:hypothetical protein [Halostagnicola sp. A56]KDE60524.1 hypothetical protein EL22_19730 [Halostagnicola sp. A56]